MAKGQLQLSASSFGSDWAEGFSSVPGKDDLVQRSLAASSARIPLPGFSFKKKGRTAVAGELFLLRKC